MLAKRRDEFNDFIHSHRALLLPIRELPPELLQEIFHHYYTIFVTWFTFQRDARPPFILTQVCTAWRNAAIALPSLWVKIPAFNLSRGKTHEAGYLSFVEELFRRSGGLAMLEVFVYYYPLSGKAESHPVMDILIRHSERLKILTLDGNQGALDVFAGAKGRLPNLVQLGLHIPATAEDLWQTPGVVIAKNDTFEEAPKLEIVKMPRKTRPAWLMLPLQTIIKFDNEPLQWALRTGGES
ncbi:hypothetical protein NLJ89_g5216 [Agrocybe chaxingu]|uniref:F-box domain-containing protein n=1 Tax=Agrocybe chaxingu TaxID=84603 RepID=A0A9W8K2Q9_9AGAR|nr:hypothetical protein NLJ89_g5216 [Agrocybe chaxingu]